MAETYPSECVPIPNEDIVSRYRNVAEEALRRAAQDDIDKAKQPNDQVVGKPERTVEAVLPVFRHIDRQGIENYKLHTSSEYPGVLAPFTHISVNQLAQDLLGAPTPIPAEQRSDTDTDTAVQRRIVAIFPAWAQYPGGHAFDLWGAVYHEAIKWLPSVAQAMREGKPCPEVEVYSMGLPHSVVEQKGVTREWVEHLRKHGLDPYGRLYAELFQDQILPKGGDGKPPLKGTAIQLKGVSMGGEIARSVAAHLDNPEFQALKEQQRLAVLALIPTGAYRPETRIAFALNLLQKPLGLMGEGIIRYILDRGFRAEVRAEGPFLRELHRLTQEKLRRPDHESAPGELSPKASLVKEAARADARTLIKGSQPIGRDITRIHIIEGIYDPVNSNLALLGRALMRMAGVGRVKREELRQKIATRPDTYTEEFEEKIGHTALGQVMSMTQVSTRSGSAEQRVSHYGVRTTHYIDYRDKRAGGWWRRLSRALDVKK